MNNLFFKYLNWILKVDKEKPDIQKTNVYMTNRWLSMASKPICQIVNSTSNRWNILDDEIISKFFHCVIPKHQKRIQYIKKSSQENEDEIENVDNLCSAMEISRKELQQYHETLAELKLVNK